MFESLTEKFNSVFRSLAGRGRITEANISDAMRDVRKALLEADVNYNVVKQFCKDVTQAAIGAEVIKSLHPSQVLVKIVSDELTKLMGPVDTRIYFVSPGPTVIMLAGLQGCGKTTALAALGQVICTRLTPEQAQITIIDPKTDLIGRIQGPAVRAYAYTPDDIDTVLTELAASLADRLPPAGLTQDELLARPPWRGPHHFVLIDDEQELRPGGVVGRPAATAPLWNLVERSREIGLHVIASRLPGNWAAVSAMNPLLQKLTGSRAPTLFMDNDPQTVKVFGRVSARQLSPGRGLLVSTEGVVEGVLVGTPDELESQSGGGGI